MVERILQPHPEVLIGVVGKYADLHDAYLSVREALRHAGYSQDHSVSIDFIQSENLETEDAESLLRHVSGIVVPGGFGPRGTEGMIKAATYARENKVPYLGLCLGMQVMVIEHARKVLGLDDANSSEFDTRSNNHVIHLMDDQKDVDSMGGTMRLGNYPCTIIPNSMASAAYGTGQVLERHRHRFEFNNSYREALQETGLYASGLSPDGKLVEIVEQIDHPFMVGVQFHPEFRSRPLKPHPLFSEFISAASKVIREGDQHQFAIGR